HLFSWFADRYSVALVCHRWRYLVCHPRLWLRVENSIRNMGEPGVFPNLEAAISAARFIGGGELPDDTVLTCSRGSERFDHLIGVLRMVDSDFLASDRTSSLTETSSSSFVNMQCLLWYLYSFCFHQLEFLMLKCLHSALEFLSTCKITNLMIKAELGCCLLHRSGRLTIEGCILQCEANPLDYLSFPIMSTANGCHSFPQPVKGHGDGVTVARTRIEGGAKAVWTSGHLVLQRVRAIYSRTSIFFWFEVAEQ
ncbi:hypothetical protein B296_00041879, partial [Ensete ventricosum]